ncbi:hypothetical protein Pcinc_006820 [Petrolisthes cinctipes]|uniref:Peptidase A2 domain-containing protein n=1 Tax=Petrolisthes cinctipes TaxID=88211 RepID=A0AAE1KY32_PETCI|nr:hypothetical protein Pcinc_006820 [Petrolisthes cinctipes]
MFPPNSNSVPPVFPHNSHSVPPMFPPNSNSVLPMFPPNSNSVPPVFPPNSQSVPPVFPPTSNSVPPVFPHNSHSVPPMFPPNANSVLPMFPPNSNSVPPVFHPNSQSVLPVFPPHSHSVLPVFPPNPLNDVPVHFSRPAGTTQLGGKRTGRGAVNTLPAATPNSSRQLLFVLDSTSGARFLVDTGATVGAVPPSAADKATEYPSYDLLAANGTSIATYGTRTLNLDLGLPEKVIWSFIVADVRHPILGLDFLHSQDLIVDSRYQQLHHRPTTCTIKATPCAEVTPRITHVSPEPAYTSLLQEFPELTSTTPHSGRKRHNVMHRIITQGQPCFARPRRLPPERLQAAKKEFEQLLQEGVDKRNCFEANNKQSSSLRGLIRDYVWRPTDVGSRELPAGMEVTLEETLPYPETLACVELTSVTTPERYYSGTVYILYCTYVNTTSGWNTVFTSTPYTCFVMPTNP